MMTSAISFLASVRDVPSDTARDDSLSIIVYPLAAAGLFAAWLLVEHICTSRAQRRRERMTPNPSSSPPPEHPSALTAAPEANS